MFEQSYPLTQNTSSYSLPQSGLTAPHVQQMQHLYTVLWSAWNQNYTREQILESCTKNLTRDLQSCAEILLDHIETNSQPSPLKVAAFKIEITNTFRATPTVAAMEKLVAKTKNLYLKDLAQQAVEKLREAQSQGRLPSVADSVKLTDPLKIVLQEQVSVLLFGNSGSGKTSLALRIISTVSRGLNKPVQVIVLDPHLNDWGNLPIISRQEDILRTLDRIVKELIRRREDWERQIRELPPEQRSKETWAYLIVVWDEIDDALTFADTKLGKALIKHEKLFHPSDALRILGAQLRKFEGMLVGMNQSRNCDALSLDSNQRSNFVDIDLGESALNQAAILWKVDAPERIFIESKREGYPCLVRSRPAIHPTHGHYQIRKNHQPPVPSESPLIEPWSLDLPAEPLVFRGNLADAFCGAINIPGKSVALPETVVADEVCDDPWESSNNSPSLYEDYVDILQKRTANNPQSKTEICNSWTGKTEEKFLRYDQALEQYGHLWIKELAKDGMLNHSLDELVTLFWGIPKNRNHRKKFYAYKRLLTQMVGKLDISPQSKNTGNIIQFPKNANE